MKKITRFKKKRKRKYFLTLFKEFIKHHEPVFFGEHNKNYVFCFGRYCPHCKVLKMCKNNYITYKNYLEIKKIVPGVFYMKTKKLNESFSYLEAESDNDKKTIQNIFNFLRVERPGAFFDPLVKSGFKSPFDFFASIQNGHLLIMNGHLSLLKPFNIFPEPQISDYSDDIISNFLFDVKKILPFEPYDFQEKTFISSIKECKQINKCCTSSGKSLVISLIAEFFRRQGKKGLLLVPNINLLTQFKNDILTYNLNELYNDCHIIGGGSTDRHFNNSITISTWQSLLNYHDNLDNLDYVICDECLHPKTLIETINGKKEIQKITPGEYVLTLNETTNKKEFKVVKKVHKNLKKTKRQKILKIVLEDNNIIKITGDHKVLTDRGWVRANELTLNDNIIQL